jgi:hypothetical protein
MLANKLCKFCGKNLKDDEIVVTEKGAGYGVRIDHACESDTVVEFFINSSYESEAKAREAATRIWNEENG